MFTPEQPKKLRPVSTMCLAIVEDELFYHLLLLNHSILFLPVAILVHVETRLNLEITTPPHMCGHTLTVLQLH